MPSREKAYEYLRLSATLFSNTDINLRNKASQLISVYKFQSGCIATEPPSVRHEGTVSGSNNTVSFWRRDNIGNRRFSKVRYRLILVKLNGRIETKKGYMTYCR